MYLWKELPERSCCAHVWLHFIDEGCNKMSVSLCKDRYNAGTALENGAESCYIIFID